MTEAELEAERNYRFEERLGILTDGAKPTDQQIQAAKAEANEVIEKLKLNTK